MPNRRAREPGGGCRLQPFLSLRLRRAPAPASVTSRQGPGWFFQPQGLRLRGLCPARLPSCELQSRSTAHRPLPSSPHRAPRASLLAADEHRPQGQGWLHRPLSPWARRPQSYLPTRATAPVMTLTGRRRHGIPPVHRPRPAASCPACPCALPEARVTCLGRHVGLSLGLSLRPQHSSLLLCV